MSASGRLFSVVVRCHGHERYVEAAIESLWTQTFENFEIIGALDRSADAIGHVLDKLAARSPRPMRVVRAVDPGAQAALNAGSAYATAEYLAFLEAEDVYLPDRLDAFARVARKCESFRWGFSGVQPIDEGGRLVQSAAVPDVGNPAGIHRFMEPLKAARDLPRENTMVSSGNLVVNAELFRDLGGFRNLRFTHAWDLGLRLLDHGDPFVVERPLYQYRVHSTANNGRLVVEDALLAARETELIIGEHRNRMVVPPLFMPLVAASVEPLPDLDRDEAQAVKATLWALGKLRSIPPAYVVVRNAARIIRICRQLWMRRH